MNRNAAISESRTDQVGNPEPGGGQEAARTPQRDRRRAIGAGAAVLLSLQARTVLGNTACQSPSGQYSGNQSPRPGEQPPCALGRSPGFWKQPQWFLSAWAAAGVMPPKFSVQVGDCFTGMGEIQRSDIVNPGTLFTAIFNNTTAPAEFSGAGIWEVLAYPNRFGAYGQLARHCIAAVLNARSIPYYPVTEMQAKQMWAGGLGSGYCPIATGCGGNTWDAGQIVFYIESTYDGSNEVQICKKPKI